MEQEVTSVVCKMQCHGTGPVYENQPETDARVQINLGAVWEGSTEAQAKSENAIFGEATPAAWLGMAIVNPVAAAFFKTNKKYYVTFTEAPD